MIPYILEKQSTGPAFFPPIVATMLPFREGEPVQEFPKAKDGGTIKEDFGNWNEEKYKDSMSVKLLAYEDGKIHPLNLGRLEWNDVNTKLVVLDGQHRAMALLAIQRTLKRTWDDSGRGKKYKHFYEDRVREYLNELGEEFNIEGIEFPVTICWFPEVDDQHKAARKLFVDVNKNARAPSESRLVLLSDTEIINILTRSLLNEMRKVKSVLPVYIIEYDNPKDQVKPIKNTVVASLDMVKNGVLRSVFGPSGYINNVSKTMTGPKNWGNKNEYFRSELELDKILPKKIKMDGEGKFDRSKILNDNFPREAIEKIEEKFINTWGSAILVVLEKLLPYSAHVSALKDIESDWDPTESGNELAKEALFEGLGVYWTLKDSYEHWKDLKRKTGEKGTAETEIVKAWNIIEKQEDNFFNIRSLKYLGSESDKSVLLSNKAFRIYNTHACFLSIIMTIAALKNRLNKPIDEIVELTNLIVGGWNVYLSSGSEEYKNMLVLLRDEVKAPINKIGKMDSTDSVYYRYFWLEMLCSNIAKKHCKKRLDYKEVEKTRNEARTLYRMKVIKDLMRSIRSANNDWTDDRIKKSATKKADKQISNALKYWFGIEDPQYKAWVEKEYVEDAQEVDDNGENNG